MLKSPFSSPQFKLKGGRMNGSGGLSVGAHQSDGIYSGSSRRQKGRAIAPFLGRLLPGGLQKYKTLLKHYALKKKQTTTNKQTLCLRKGDHRISLQPFGSIIPRGSSNGSVGLDWAGVELSSKQQNLDRLGMQLEGRWGKDRMRFLFVCPAV